MYHKNIKELERSYIEYCKHYKIEELRNIEQIANHEHQKQKFFIIQNKINEINHERLKLDSEIIEKIEISDHYVY